jgi:hypothetical protein
MKNGFHIDADGTKAWYKNGELHRTDGAAVEQAAWNTTDPALPCSFGTKAWYLNGQRHRTDGPAIEHADEFKAWYLNGQRHRTNGPAVECADGYKEYWVRGIRITKKKFYSKAFQVQLVMDE